MSFAEHKDSIRLVIFDLDGTLIDSKADLIMSVNATLRHLGRAPLHDDVIASYVGRGAQVLIQRALGEGVTRAEVENGLRFFLHYYWNHKLEHTRLYPGVRETLDRLAEARTLAVLTNKPENVSREILRELGLLGLFNVVYGGNSFATKKPHPEGIMQILTQTRSNASEAIIVGDSDVDVLTGRNAGTWTCGVTYGFGTLQSDDGAPDLVIDRLPELLDALDGSPPASA